MLLSAASLTCLGLFGKAASDLSRALDIHYTDLQQF